MANYYGKWITNAFQVENPEEFKKYLSDKDVNVCEGADGFFELYDNDYDGGGSIPCFREVLDPDGTDGETIEEEYDFFDEVAKFLTKDTVLVFQATGSEKHRYLVGEAFAMDCTGAIVSVSINEITKLAKEKFAGKHVASC
jgi:hypothetical protein